MRIYTGTGDDGTTSLVGGRRVQKTDMRLEAYGTVDELNSHLGLLSSKLSCQEDINGIRWIQNLLFSVGGALATDTESTDTPASCVIEGCHIQQIERMIDNAGVGLPAQKAFILPGGCETAAICHVARTVCRRAERCILRLHQQHPVDCNLLVFINRLSDYLFVMSRKLNFSNGCEEVYWGERYHQ